MLHATSSSANTASAARTFCLSGMRYEPECLSGNIDVDHVVAPIVIVMGIEPKPRRLVAKVCLISSAMFFGKPIECQAALSPDQRNTLLVN